MKRLHLVPEASEANGVFQVARMLAKRDGGELRDMDGVPYVVDGKELKGPLGWVEAATPEGCGHPVGWFDEVWVHGMWLPRVWGACRMALRAGKRLVRMTHGSLSPIYLERQSKWKKRLVSPVERHYFAKCDRVVVTGGWEEEWCRKWGLKGPFETVDLKEFFDFSRVEHVERVEKGELHLLYLGRRHPLKGVEYLETAVKQIKESSASLRLCVKYISSAFGEEKEKVWDWCDVLVLPTLSENFGLVVAEALERGKRVITTDGAPAWGDGNDYGGRLIYLKGFRDGTDEMRIRLLKEAIEKWRQG
jgi:glycosyltransferase involved in cell wall biosynthesis